MRLPVRMETSSSIRASATTNPVTATAGSGKITRLINYASDASALKFVTGLLATPENYYVNIHTTVQPTGLMRGQLRASRLLLRPAMSTASEVPPVDLDAEGAAAIEVQVNRDPQTGAITSGTVTFNVDYRFPAAVTITGLHIHNGAPARMAQSSSIRASTRHRRR